MSDSYIRRVLSHDAAWDTIFVRCRIVPLIEKHLNPYKNSRGNIRSNACRGVLSELCRVSIRLVDLRTSSNSFFLPNRSNVRDHRCSDWRLLVSNRRTTIRESNCLEDTWLFEIRVMIIELIAGECMFVVHRRRFKFDKCLNLRVISSEVESRLCLELNRGDVTLFVKNIVVWPFLISFV